MSKRKLTRQQAWRIEKIQAERRDRARKRAERSDEALESGTLGEEQSGLVIAHFGTQVEIEGEDKRIQRCHLRANLESLVTGDEVAWCPGEPTGVVVARHPRRSELLRPTQHGGLKPVAANVDRIFVVIAPLPPPHANLIDRYLVAAEAVNIEPVLLVNKTDLLEDNPELQREMDALLAPYAALGYLQVRASSRRGGLEDLQAALAGQVSILVGQSGVGKSSLVNALLPGVDLQVGPLSNQGDKGTHTTTTARLFHLPAGGSLIDSPGIREFGLWHMQRDQVEWGFREFRALLGHCRFRDCRHEQEPGCAILEAAAAGRIHPARLDSYRHIVASLNTPEEAGYR
ncbi:MAG: ribosome biogenesis GTPase RsgA [Haliea sp.]|nr:ribosome biogenesis GTPase RsgA [Haliea sp.]|tara:strand:- start:190 stop:1221 length:1032 start_codon:yes stop_codon:yes gene_type:complete